MFVIGNDVDHFKAMLCIRIFTKAFLKGWKSGYFINVDQFPCPGPAADPHFQYGSELGSRRAKSKRIPADPDPQHRF